MAAVKYLLIAQAGNGRPANIEYLNDPDGSMTEEDLQDTIHEYNQGGQIAVILNEEETAELKNFLS